MKNLFEFLLTDDNTLDEDVFASFSDWMFEGNDFTNKLSRIFLRWSVLYLIQNSGTEGLENEDFFAFFQEFDRTEFESFISYISQDPVIALSVEQTLGGDSPYKFSGDTQPTYWYFISEIADHIEKNNLFPTVPEVRTNVLNFNMDDQASSKPGGERKPLSNDDREKLIKVFRIIFLVFVVAYVLLNLI